MADSFFISRKFLFYVILQTCLPVTDSQAFGDGITQAGRNIYT